MKKYMLFLFAFAFIFSLFNMNVNSLSAETASSLPAGCTSTHGYSPLTGVKCDTVINPALPAGCTSNDGYSPTTGVKCDTTTSSSLPHGCTSTTGYSPITGVKCDSSNHESFPPGCSSSVGYSSTTGQPCSEEDSSVVITGVSGPQTLGVNEEGTWTIKAYDKNRGDLSYSVSWGDEGYQTSSGLVAFMPEQQSATFSHKYSTIGTFKPTFTVRSDNRIVCFRAPCPSGSGSATTSLSVNVVSGTTTVPALRVLSPNGGETIKLTDEFKVVFKPVLNQKHYINLYNSSTDGAYMLKIENSNTDGTVTGKYNDGEKQVVYASIPSNYNIQPGDKFKIEICGGSHCDKSDNNFKITSTSHCSSSGYDTTTGFRCGCTGTTGYSSHNGESCGDDDDLLSCSILKNTQEYYYNTCKNEGFENVCFSKEGVFQGCSYNANNDCTANNTNARTNLLCSVGATQAIITTSSNNTVGDTRGTIYPSGKIAVPYGSNQTFTFTPNRGYEVSSINIDNKISLPGASSYTFHNVIGSHVIGVIFSRFSVPTCSSSGYDSTTGFYCGCTSTNGYSSYDGMSCEI